MNWPDTETTATPLSTPPAADAFNNETTNESLKRRATDALVTGEEYVRQNPLATLITAVVVGTVVGVILAQIGRDDEEEVARGRLSGARDWLGDAYGGVRDRVSAVEIPTGKLQAARDWVGHTYSDVRDRVSEVEVPTEKLRAARDWVGHTYSDVKDRIPEVHMPHLGAHKHRFAFPKFRREPTLLEKIEEAVFRLKFW